MRHKFVCYGTYRTDTFGIQSGNIEIFYNELYAKLLVYASRHLGPDYAFLAEDCVQDAVYKAYEQRITFKSILTFKAFLYSCIHHAAIDILRNNQTRSKYLSQQNDRTEFLNSIIEQETLNQLYDAIERLPEKYRRIFELHFEQGLKNAEIAVLQDVTESAVKNKRPGYWNYSAKTCKNERAIIFSLLHFCHNGWNKNGILIN